MSHDTDLIIQQDEKNKADKKKKRKRKKKKKADREAEEEDGLPREKKAHLEDADQELRDEEECETIATASKRQESGGDETEAACGYGSGRMGRAENGNVPKKQDSATDDGKTAQQMSEGLTGSRERKVEGGTHRAGFDAFMTGYIFAFASITKTEESAAQLAIPGCVNKLYLSGKSVPLQVVKSTFSKSSKAHMHKMEQIWGKGSSTVSSDSTA